MLFAQKCFLDVDFLSSMKEQAMFCLCLCLQKVFQLIQKNSFRHGNKIVLLSIVLTAASILSSSHVKSVFLHGKVSPHTRSQTKEFNKVTTFSSSFNLFICEVSDSMSKAKSSRFITMFVFNADSCVRFRPNIPINLYLYLNTREKTSFKRQHLYVGGKQLSSSG